MLPNPFFLALMTASASAHYMQVTTWSGKNCHGSSEIGCKSTSFPDPTQSTTCLSVKRSSSSQHTSQKTSTTKPPTASPIPGGSFNGLHWDFINHGGMHCKMTTWSGNDCRGSSAVYEAIEWESFPCAVVPFGSYVLECH